MKCRFYDDGHGNGSYIPGSCCGPPNCHLNGNESCEGNIKKCNINNKRLKELNKQIKNIKNEF